MQKYNLNGVEEEKIVDVMGRELFHRLKDSTSEEVLTEYYESQLGEGFRFTNLDLYVLVCQGNITYTGNITEQVLIDLSNRLVRVSMYTENNVNVSEYTESQLNSLKVFKQFRRDKNLQTFN